MLEGKTISIIFACSVYAQNGKLVIGYKDDLPEWKGLIPSDMDRFKFLTKEQDVLMGFKTFLSIPERFRPFDKDLPIGQGRQTLIMTRNTALNSSNPRVRFVHSLDEAARIAKSKILWIAGGAQIYTLALPYADYIHQTMISKKVVGDTFFPEEWNLDEWRELFSRFYRAGEPQNFRDKVNSFYKIFERKDR